MRVNFYIVGSILIVAALGLRSYTLARLLMRGGGLATVDAALLTQILIFLTLIAGFIFQQIGRYQEARASIQRAQLLAEATRLAAENLALQAQLAHKETIDHITVLHSATVTALDVANHANEKIAATQEKVAAALRALPIPSPIDRTPDTVLVEVPIAVEGTP